jgi:internalin A
VVISFEYNIDRNAAGSLSSLADLHWCKNLETLDILEQKGLTSIEPLRGLDKLWNVDIFGCAVSDLSPLAGSEALRMIRISDCPVTDASPVLSLPNLEMFNAFFGTGISDISALSGTHNLKFFSSQKRFPDYTPLLAHKGLEDVSLTGITDEFFRELLANCRNLRSIRIISSDIRDESLSLLSDLHLYSLSLDNCGLEDISALAGLTSLQDLQIINNYVTDITPIGKLTQLVNSLDIQYNSINDLTPLENLKKLANLTVTGNPYTDASVLDKLEQNGCKVNR